MVPDLKEYKSHPNKLLLNHINGVIKNVNGITNSTLAKLVAIFHDLGKMNPNFQNKVTGKSCHGYDKHSYLSAYVFFCLCVSDADNRNVIQKFLGWKSFTYNDVIGITTLIAKHHGNLPDFSPKGTIASILSRKECKDLFDFLSSSNIPIYEFVSKFIKVKDFSILLNDKKVQKCFIDNFVFQSKYNQNPLDFYLALQFSFSSVIQSDKADAACYDNFIGNEKQDVVSFSKIYNEKLDTYLSTLKQNLALNQLRTKIRLNAVENILNGLDKGFRIFDLTAPTGSGKTLMLLSLASEIMKSKGAKRIIYGLPFLSITEQVEDEVTKIFKGYEKYIQRIDSKSENKQFEELQVKLENEPSEENIEKLNIAEFQENTFSYPFVITTFVRLFETLLSNRNAELLKLPNFSHCIFLLDEIQALPPRLYGFFIAYLTRFCEEFDSYAIISTATQPNFELPSNNEKVKSFFCQYRNPLPLLPLSYFNNDLFNRYNISYNKNEISINELKDDIINETSSVLVILNTINDTYDLYSLLKEELHENELILLNTHFTPRDRTLKIYLAKRRLRENKKIIVISTQLIEAGVDIDFPVLYRDFAIVPSIIQSAGRCNRNGKLPGLGKVKIFCLKNRGKNRSELIYRESDSDLLRFTKESFVNSNYKEESLISTQKSYFDKVQSQLYFAKYGDKLDNDFLDDIEECMFNKIGNFKLINDNVYGEQFQYFIAKNDRDNKFEILQILQDDLIELFKTRSDITLIKKKKKEIEIQLKKMANQIVQIRLKKNQQKPLTGSDEPYFNLYKIDKGCYSFELGVDLNGNEFIL